MQKTRTLFRLKEESRTIKIVRLDLTQKKGDAKLHPRSISLRNLRYARGPI